MRARLEEADGRAARWAQRAGMAETLLPPTHPLNRVDSGAVPSPAACEATAFAVTDTPTQCRHDAFRTSSNARFILLVISSMVCHS